MLTERFWNKVEKTATCWLWRATIRRDGYGIFYFEGRIRSTHRLSYEAAQGPIPAGLCVLHRCDVKACVRPDHLTVGTKSENTQDCVRKNRHHKTGCNSDGVRFSHFKKTGLCKKGLHDITDPSSTVPRPKRGTAECRACRNARQIHRNLIGKTSS